MVEAINEQVDAMASFIDGALKPRKFVWGRREHLIEAIHLAHRAREGKTEFYFFSVSDGANIFKLVFNKDTLEWMLEEMYV